MKHQVSKLNSSSLSALCFSCFVTIFNLLRSPAADPLGRSPAYALCWPSGSRWLPHPSSLQSRKWRRNVCFYLAGTSVLCDGHHEENKNVLNLVFLQRDLAHLSVANKGACHLIDALPRSHSDDVAGRYEAGPLFYLSLETQKRPSVTGLEWNQSSCLYNISAVLTTEPWFWAEGPGPQTHPPPLLIGVIDHSDAVTSAENKHFPP